MTARPRSDQHGTTLVELTVVMLMLSIVGVLLFSFLWSVVNTTTRTTSNIEAEKATELALRPLTENARSASFLATTYPSLNSCPSGSYPTGFTNCLSFTVSRPASGQLTCRKSVFVYGLKSDGVLREDRTDYAVVSGVCSVVASTYGRPLLKGVSNGTTPLFSYFDRFGNLLDPAGSGVSAATFNGAVTLRVSLNVAYQRGSPLLKYTSDLAMRNSR